MKTATVAALIAIGFAMPTFAIEGGRPPKESGPNFELKRQEILKRIDERLARIQQMKSCVQAASSRDELRACREKFGPKDGPGNRQRKEGGYPDPRPTQ